MSFGPLVDVELVRQQLDQLTLVDCRFTLGEPSAGERAYRAGHIPGAAFLDLDRDLSAPPGERGRHPLPSAADFEQAARRAGIGATSRVVAYDEAGEGGAARLWWLLRHFGHTDVAILDGGLRAWRAAGGALADGDEKAARGDLAVEEREGDSVEIEELRVARPRLLDARAPERFRGEAEPIDPIAGHIPGARNLPFAELAPDGRFLPATELRARLEAAGASAGDVAYCGSGVSATVLILAAEVAGIGPLRLYPGSWSEWSRRGLPAERQ